MKKFGLMELFKKEYNSLNELVESIHKAENCEFLNIKMDNIIRFRHTSWIDIKNIYQVRLCVLGTGKLIKLTNKAISQR